MEKEWDQQFWDTFDNHAPEAPRHVQLARLESVEPLVVNLGGLLYEQARARYTSITISPSVPMSRYRLPDVQRMAATRGR